MSELVVLVALGGNNSLQVEKKKTMSMLFVELRTCRALFALGDCGDSTEPIIALFLDHNRTSKS
jgi:hypothetical protein